MGTKNLQYPIGRLDLATLDKRVSPDTRARRIQVLAETPVRLGHAVSGLSAERLETPYRPDGWTIRQLVHHMADSHLQAYVVFKLTLTARQPLLRMYDSAAWGEMADARTEDVEVSLALLKALHLRWNTLLTSLTADDFSRSFERPEWGGLISLDNLLQMLEWHQQHHLRHISALRERMGW